MYFYFKKIIFDISASKWSKTQKKFEVKKKIKTVNFFQKRFWNKKTNSVLRNAVKKTCKNYFTKTIFQTHFFSGPYDIKHNFYSYQILCCVFCTQIQKQVQNKYTLKGSKSLDHQVNL